MESICAIKDIYKALYQFEKNFLNHHGLTINEAMLLCFLSDGECKTASSIGEHLGLSNPRVSKIINNVETKGLISRAICNKDRRQMLFNLTPEGEASLKVIHNSEIDTESLYGALEKCIKRS